MLSRLGILILLILNVQTIFASSLQVNHLTIEDAWARPTTPVVMNSAIYLKIINQSEQEYKLFKVSANNLAQTIEIHESFVDQNGVSRMVQIDNLLIPPHSIIGLAPGKTHIMLLGLTKPLMIGEKLEVTLHFADTEPIKVNVEVRSK